MYSIKIVVSTIFLLMMFPHQGKSCDSVSTYTISPSIPQTHDKKIKIMQRERTINIGVPTL
jgi:hypothetical protein